ncbi:hypothetical protein HELRODRAFT_193941 [Helobdella robusta]|uniref:Uncharacterized protein n=1 Tax=Helobdella robusta TaxID=6412 RepID=T1FVI1_HELRO|nr:hypothetical protein HELRODRAFT_193941 [Helobdella robusta]ESN93736.1 hypothetical protein HELRODRAFT_193941 [Helobdella robusta]
MTSSSSSPSPSSWEEVDGEIIMKVPNKFMNFPLGFATDAGASITKLAYRSKKDYNKGQLITPSDYGLLRLRIFKMADVCQIVDFLKENCDVMETGNGSGFENVTWYMTGVITQHFKAKLEEEFGIKTKLCSEVLGIQEIVKVSSDIKLGCYELDSKAFNLATARVQMMAKAINKVLVLESNRQEADDFKRKNDCCVCASGEELKESEISQTSSNSNFKGPVMELLSTANYAEWAEKYLKSSSNQFVAQSLFVLFGSATVVLLADEEFNMKGVDFSGAAGKTLSGLVEEMLHLQDFDEFIKMAERGNMNKVNGLMSDLKNCEHREEDWYSFFPDDYPTFELGKLTTANAKGKGIYTKDDLAAGILNFQASSLSKFAFHNCCIHKVDRVYFCGSLMKYDVARSMIATNFLTESFWHSLEGVGLMKPFFVHQPGFLVVLGLWADNVKLTKLMTDNF